MALALTFMLGILASGRRLCLWRDWSGQSRCWRKMENIRDLAYEGWTSKTSKKGKGPGKSKGRSVNREDGSEEDRS